MTDRFEVIIAGIGGQGVLVAGRLLAKAAVDRYAHVTWMSSYRAARRGGATECTVIFSQSEIASFILSKADVVLTMASSQLDTFLNRVKPGGLLIHETAGLAEQVRRPDIKSLPISAIEIANEIGAVQAANMIFLGAYTRITEALPAELVDSQLEGEFKGKALAVNRKAFKRGVEIGEDLASKVAI